MTLIVGIKCSDGIVLGADGAATYGVLGQQTIRQPVKKLKILESCIVVGVSGPIGLGQRLTATVEELWQNKKLSGKTPPVAMDIMRRAVLPHIAIEIEAAKDRWADDRSSCPTKRSQFDVGCPAHI